jgi:hypothetical protein
VQKRFWLGLKVHGSEVISLILSVGTGTSALEWGKSDVRLYVGQSGDTRRSLVIGPWSPLCDLFYLPPSTESILIFLKYLDPDKGDLRGVQSIYVEGNQKISNLASEINARMGWSPKDGVERFDETNFELVLFKETPYPHPMDGNLTLAQHHISEGDIVWFWRAQAQER